ncbi:MAG: hypothetical protein HY680_09505 [Chloroflexi bacterium]|nr:hypothetical protein [Chloroflexota bacterium]
MAVAKIVRHPELTPESAMEVFGRHFRGKYQVYKYYRWAIGGRMSFVVKKSGWTGVIVRLKQDKNGTSFEYHAFIPSWIVVALFGGLILWVLLRPVGRRLEGEVHQLIDSAAEFK